MGTEHTLRCERVRGRKQTEQANCEQQHKHREIWKMPPHPRTDRAIKNHRKRNPRNQQAHHKGLRTPHPRIINPIPNRDNDQQSKNKNGGKTGGELDGFFAAQVQYLCMARRVQKIPVATPQQPYATLTIYGGTRQHAKELQLQRF
ncbi:hypothetical protein [Thalassospira lucentensis]|uniref:hypothetical protein n=1 Tax=Thalassospira lucentensis TaxID=168935 RepID=UPI0020CA397C|nr:hypothetical protein [Thalassospira lucentensis]